MVCRAGKNVIFHAHAHWTDATFNTGIALAADNTLGVSDINGCCFGSEMCPSIDRKIVLNVSDAGPFISTQTQCNLVAVFTKATNDYTDGISRHRLSAYLAYYAIAAYVTAKNRVSFTHSITSCVKPANCQLDTCMSMQQQC